MLVKIYPNDQIRSENLREKTKARVSRRRYEK
ncbi:hypothetical protein PARA125_001287 [Parachlamydia sp. AcF125]|nr:hypothetical protein [Parachlamydia sp. AcF125]